MKAFKIGRTTGGLLKIGYGTGSAIKIVPVTFSPLVVVITNPGTTQITSTAYTIPAGATTLKGWAIGGGACTTGTTYNAGGCGYKTWSLTSNSSRSANTLNYVIGAGAIDTVSSASASRIIYAGITMTGQGGGVGGYINADGGANGGGGPNGAVGVNSASLSACGRRPATDVDGLFAALALAGISTTETCGATGAFGSSGYVNAADSNLTKTAGYGGRGHSDTFTTPGGNGVVVLYFT